MNNEDVTTQDVFENLQELLEHNEIREFREAFLDHHIYDQTQFYLDFADDERIELYSILSPQELSEIFENIDFDEVDIKPESKEVVKVRCQSCKTLNDEDAKYCKKCGAIL